VRVSTLSFQPLGEDLAEADRDRDQDKEKEAERRIARADENTQQKAAPKQVAGQAAPAESYWLVEGSKTEVTELLRGLAEYAKRSGLELANGELPEDAPVLGRRRQAARGAAPPAAVAPAAPSAPREPAPSAPAGKDKAQAIEEQARIVLRFRVLPPK
jgi:hypothetical protein